MKNKKYILIIGFFILTLILSLVLPIKYIQIFSSPLNLILIVYILKDELKSTNWNLLFLKKETYDNAIFALAIALVGQTVFNLLSIYLMNPTILDPLPLLMPIIPVYTVLSAPIIEEILFRRIIYGTLQRNKTKFSILAASVSSILFAVMHMNLVFLTGYFAVGMILCYFYHKTKSLYTVILAHCLFNFYVLLIQSINS